MRDAAAGPSKSGCSAVVCVAEDEILKAKIALLGKTNMVDYAMDIHKSLYKTEDVPPGQCRTPPACRSFVGSWP